MSVFNPSTASAEDLREEIEAVEEAIAAVAHLWLRGHCPESSEDAYLRVVNALQARLREMKQIAALKAEPINTMRA